MSHGRDFCKSDHSDLVDLMAEVSQKKNGKQMPPWQGSFLPSTKKAREVEGRA
jgi:hypothetical protein